MAKWIICCGMVRSGSTLQYQIVKNIIEEYCSGVGLGFYQGDDFINILKKHDGDKVTYVVKNHKCFEIPEAYDKNNFVFIYSYRDIRDVVVSLMNMKQKGFVDIYSPSYFNYLMNQHYNWMEQSNLYVSKYEEMTTNIVQEIRNIASVLDVNITPFYINQLADSLSIDKQLEKIKSGQNISKNKQDYSLETLLHNNHIVSGSINQWKSSLTNFEIAIIEKKWAGWLIKHQYVLHKSIYNRRFVFQVTSWWKTILNIGIVGIIKHLYRKYRSGIK